jgi:prolyl oligopeptidase
MAVAIENPPFTNVEPVAETLHGVEIVDPYRWLEDQKSPATRVWLKLQSEYAQRYFASLPNRNVIRKRVAQLLTPASKSAPYMVRGRYFFLDREADRQQPAILMRDGMYGFNRVLVDPALVTGGPSVAVSISTISGDGRFMAYALRKGGTDHATFHIFDLKQNITLPDHLSEGYCSGLIFAVDGTGFYYCHHAVNDTRPNYRAVSWHRFGTEQSKDIEIFTAGESKSLLLAVRASPDGTRLLYIVSSTEKLQRTSMYLHALHPECPPRLLVEDVEGCFNPFFAGSKLLAYTDYTAKNFRIVEIDEDNPSPNQWKDLVPQSDRVIQQFAVADDRIFVTRCDRFSVKLHWYSLNGKENGELECAPRGTVTLQHQAQPSDEIAFSHTNICRPLVTYCYRPRTPGKYRTWDEALVPFDPSSIAVEETDYESTDGVRVPILLAARKDLLHAGPLPTFLTGYGGFGNCVTPRFTALATFLIEQGLLFAVPAIRGGAELGKEWHLAGKGGNRQRSFDDFTSAAEWLVASEYSAPGRIAIGGGSNAGLLVGAAVTQRPDLFRAAICLGPLLDMLRYDKFDRAAVWSDEYGCARDEMDFRALFAYSPYHRVVAGTHYPAVLFISGDADTRCNPMHVRKMTARMQAATAAGNPILLDYKVDWGHTAVQPMDAKVEALTDRLAFVCHELGIAVIQRSF